ncbi:coproporphyrinogen III oxidase [Deltaproteobacteria bacterium]|nr:coproporphyrinogen III oxidase [Deltaproteobacteria bacterium]
MYGVYVHVPWCRIRCPYCAFAVDTRRAPDDAAWLARTLEDWARERPFFEGRPETLSFGGGTPSRADPAALATVVQAVDPAGEVSLEANPEDVTPQRLEAWRTMGVNRLSLGVQTFQPALAPRYGRAHSARDATDALLAVSKAGFRSFSVDLIYGHPEQTVAMLVEDIDHAVATGVDHVSLYSLTIEPGTRFGDRGQTVADEDHWCALHEAAVQRLEASRLQRYEVSNFSRKGARSVHNEHYWRARHWAGLGPSAHGWRPDQARVANASDVSAWLAGAPPAVEGVTGRARLWELVWSTLRHVEGVDRARVRFLTGAEVVCPAAAIEAGLLVEDSASIRLTPDGFAVSDAVVEAVVQATVRAASWIVGSS